MNRNVQLAVAGLVLLLPALILVSSGLLGLEPPPALVHPVPVLGGLILAFSLNALSVLRVRFGQDRAGLWGTISVRVRGGVMNLVALAVSCLLVATITAYLIVENFQPR